MKMILPTSSISSVLPPVVPRLLALEQGVKNMTHRLDLACRVTLFGLLSYWQSSGSCGAWPAMVFGALWSHWLWTWAASKLPPLQVTLEWELQDPLLPIGPSYHRQMPALGLPPTAAAKWPQTSCCL